jgi:hypothetical protein
MKWHGCAIAQGVSHQLPLWWPEFDPRSCGIYGGKSGNGADLLQVLQFSELLHIPQSSYHRRYVVSIFKTQQTGKAQLN